MNFGGMNFLVCSSGSGCNPLCDANEKTDTVRIDMSPEHYDQENATPNIIFDERPFSIDADILKAAKRQIEIAQAAAIEATAERQNLRRLASAREAAEEAQRLAAELAADDEDAIAEREWQRHEAMEREAAERRRLEEELHALRAHQMKEEAQREERERQSAERKREEEEQERQRQDLEHKAAQREKVRIFLLEHGYLGVNAKRTKMLKSKYALHSAVKLADAGMVQLLRAFGADNSLTNSAGETPAQLARKLNKGGTHDGVLAALA